MWMGVFYFILFYFILLLVIAVNRFVSDELVQWVWKLIPRISSMLQLNLLNMTADSTSVPYDILRKTDRKVTVLHKFIITVW